MPRAEDGDEELGMLVLRAQLGDREAFDALYSSILPRLTRYVGAILRDDAARDDVVQEVLLLVYRKLRWLREPSSFRAWIYRLAAREAIRASVSKGRRAETHLLPEEWETLRGYERNSERRLLGEAALREIAHLSPGSRAVLGLHYLEDIDIRTAAEILGLPVGTAKSRLAFGIQALRTRLGLAGSRRGTRA